MLARIGQVVVCSLDHCKDSYWRVRSLMRWRKAWEALSAMMELQRLAMSIARNMRERKVGKSSSRRVGRCRGFIEMVPVAGSMTMLCSPVSLPEITIPFAVPAAAMYGSRLGSGVLSAMEIGAKRLSSRHFLTRMSSWLKDHSFAEKRVAWC